MTELNEALDRALDLLNRIQAALGTDETGSGLVEVARNAHKAEQELASITNLVRDDDVMEVEINGVRWSRHSVLKNKRRPRP